MPRSYSNHEDTLQSQNWPKKKTWEETPPWEEKWDAADRFLWSSNLRLLMMWLIDAFVHIKDQILEMFEGSSILDFRQPTTAQILLDRLSTVAKSDQQGAGCEVPQCVGHSSVLQAEHPWVCPLASWHFCVPPNCTAFLWDKLQISCSTPLQLWLYE